MEHIGILPDCRELFGEIKTINDVISAYNAGLGGIGKNPSYISKVLKYYKE